jgi:hypothetical protein
MKWGPIFTTALTFIRENKKVSTPCRGGSRTAPTTCLFWLIPPDHLGRNFENAEPYSSAKASKEIGEKMSFGLSIDMIQILK